MAARAASSVVPEGTWLVADRQTAGRGRRGREWFDGAGNFMGSTVVHVRAGDPPAPTLALVAGLAVAEVVSALLPPSHLPLLKWPNDVLVGSAKLAGILLEREGDVIVIGVGVNLIACPQLPDRSTVALSDLAKPVERDAFSGELAHVFALELDRWRGVGLDPMLRRWLAFGPPEGTPIKIGGLAEGPVHGSFAGLGSNGALQLRLADGTTRAIHSGEVTFARIEN